jgi:hypothetical protein
MLFHGFNYSIRTQEKQSDSTIPREAQQEFHVSTTPTGSLQRHKSDTIQNRDYTANNKLVYPKT